ncbi:anti-phage dCTP deaminase [Amorphoplanes nipponensis]|nr:deaminase [Actinoplanes nipponensis]
MNESSTHPESHALPLGHELFFALVRPVGVAGDDFCRKLAGVLLSYNYDTQFVKLSDILVDLLLSEDKVDLTSDSYDVRLGKLMDFGNGLCEKEGSAAAVALHGVADIRRRREEVRKPSVGGGGLAETSPARTCYVIDALKRPSEVTTLRAIYGDGLFIVGLQASIETRRRTLTTEMTPASLGKSAEDVLETACRLIERDLQESGSYGQNMLKTFPMCDIFIDIDSHVGDQTERVVDLIFGSPSFHPPTSSEYGMQLADDARTRSAELGRKVGAVMMRDGRSVIGMGANSHPIIEASPSFDASMVAVKELVLDTLRKLGDSHLREETVSCLTKDPNQLVEDLLNGALKDADIRDLTEFQNTVHAEMSALLDALRSGHRIDDSVIYVTAYPCHGCAKHIISLGVNVEYLEPYPKSRASAMYGDAVIGSFKPFTGVSPRRYRHLFVVAEDRKSATGRMKPWGRYERSTAIPLTASMDGEAVLARESDALSALQGHNSGE